MALIEISDGGYCEANGMKLHYASSGKAGDPLLLFLHGFPEFWYAWRRQLEAFGGKWHAVAPDMRGYNLSSKPAAVEAYAMKHLVEDVRALAARLAGAGTKFTLVGHDWGGAVAWAFAMAHPELLNKLVIVNAPHPAVFARELNENPAQQRASQYMLRFREPEIEKVLEADGYAALEWAVMRMARAGAFTPDDIAEYKKAWAQPGALTGGLNYYRASRVGPPDGSGEPARGVPATALRRIEVPVLVIWGERDFALLPGNLEGLEEYVADLRIHRVPECTHWVVHEEPEMVNRVIGEFLAV